MTEILLKQTDARLKLDVGDTTWRRLRAMPGFPKPVLIRGSKRFIERELDEWLAKQADSRTT